MIFATVGTHEDPFDRLIGALDALDTDEEIVVQYGYSAPPRRARGERMMPFDAIQDHMARARVVITHGGPASIMQALAHGKVPIVVPRQSRFGEHVDDHQVRFAGRVADRVIVVLDVAELAPAIRDYDTRAKAAGTYGPERARQFAEKLDALCEDLLTRTPRPAR
ncbi:MAG: glycosyltransferase [Myxococcota bacterium]